MNKSQRIRIAAQELRLVRHAEMGPVYFHGETMRPFLGEGDLVIVEPIAWDAIRVGDIVTYRFENKFPTRRVVSIDRRSGRLILRGDSIRGRPNFLVRRDDVLGRAEARVRDGKIVSRRSSEWRWACFRALSAHRLSNMVAVGRRIVRRVTSRMAAHQTSQ